MGGARLPKRDGEVDDQVSWGWHGRSVVPLSSYSCEYGCVPQALSSSWTGSACAMMAGDLQSSDLRSEKLEKLEKLERGVVQCSLEVCRVCSRDLEESR